MKKKIKKLLEHYKELLIKDPRNIRDIMFGYESAYDLVYRIYLYDIISLEEFQEMRDIMMNM